MMKHHFMYPYHWVILIVGLILLIAGIAYLLRRPSGGPPGGGVEGKTPVDILKERYARGEIDREEFERMKKDLE